MKSVVSNKTAMNDQVLPNVRCQNANPPALYTVDRRLRHMARTEVSNNLPTIWNCCVVHSVSIRGRHDRHGAPFRNAAITLSGK